MTSAVQQAPTRLPVQPTTAIAVVKQVQNPHASNQTMARLVEYDPALAATALRLANSPFFGLGGRVAATRQAVVLLGAKTIGALAVSGTASLVFSDDEHSAPPSYWPHALTTAIAAAAVAKDSGWSVDEAFTAGILHEIAALADPSTAAAGLHADYSPASIAATAGAQLISDWGLPRLLASAVRQHQSAGNVIAEPIAMALAAGHALATVIDGTANQLTARPVEIFGQLGLPVARVESLTRQIQTEVASVSKFIAEAAR